MSNSICDIIVPIYNAYDELVECVNSIFKSTTDQEYRLILINDKSTDIRIERYLNNLALKNIPNVIIMSNDVNLGFVKTVNRAIKFSDNDVVLLNSDTIVTKRWLKKIRTCAYKDRTIATVTPLTNNGTICSIPNFCEDNIIPQNFTLEEYSAMIEKNSLRKYPIIPTAVGFCMFIKRSVLNEIGILDEENFNKGYGEENDFCCRAIEHGYINVLCDDTFIYHKGSMSFKEQTKKYIEENSVVLKKKYPYYFKNISEFIKKNPLSDIHENIKLHIKLNNKKRNVLYIFHNNTFLSDNCLKDAPELHLRYLIEHINEINRFVLISNGKQLLLIALVDNDKIYFKFDIQEEITYTTFHLYQYENILEQIITGFNIDLIHVQHLKNHTLDITEVALRLGIPKVITLYDFYMLCPLGDFINSEGKKCTSFIDQETCLRCVKNKMGYNSDFLKTWNNRMKSEIKKYDKIFTSIEFIKDVVEKYYDDLSLNIEVVESDITAMKPVVEIEKNKAEEGTNNTKLIDYNIRDEIINKYLNEYNKLINAFKGKMDVLLSNFDPYLIYNSYKNIYHNNLYKDLYFSILNVIDKNIWERYVKNISSKINIDTDLLSYMKFYLSYLINKFKNEKVDYVIWGAGSSGRVTKIILEEIMPNMKLIGYVDKFKEGNIEGVKVHKPENLKDVKFNYIIIATSSGKDEAEEFLNNMNLSMLNNYIFGYGVIPNHRYDIQKNIRHIWDI